MTHVWLDGLHSFEQAPLLVGNMADLVMPIADDGNGSPLERLPVDVLLELLGNFEDGYTLAAFAECTSKQLNVATAPFLTPCWKQQHSALCQVAAEEAMEAEDSAAENDAPVFLPRAQLLLSTRRRNAGLQTIEHYFMPHSDTQAWKLAYVRTLALHRRCTQKAELSRSTKQQQQKPSVDERENDPRQTLMPQYLVKLRPAGGLSSPPVLRELQITSLSPELS